MLDDRTNKTKLAGARINVHEPYELASWSEKLGHSADKIRYAVACVGNLAKDVQKELNK
jgi:hypothetical protein